MYIKRLKLYINRFLFFIFIFMICQGGFVNALSAASTGDLNGVITDLRTSKSVNNAKVTISMGGNNQSTETDQSGKYEFKNILSGEYLVTVEVLNYNIANQKVTVSPGIKTVNDFAITKKRGSLKGKAVDANTNNALENVLITAFDGERSYSQTTDSNGNYIINNLFLGNYTVKAALDNYNEIAPENILIDNDPTNKDFSLSSEKGDITGKVTNGTDKTPLQSVNIVLKNGVNMYNATTDSNGIFTINNVNAGSYNMTANLKGFDEKQFSDILVQGLNIASQDFELNKQAGNLSGIVKDSNNNPLSGVSIFLTNGTNNYSSITDENGKYSFSNLAIGIYTLTASLESYNMKSININIGNYGSNAQDITISKLNGKIVGSVIDSSNGNKIQGAKITITNGKDKYVEYTDENGNYEFNNIALGKYKLTIEYGNYDVKTISDVVINDFDTKLLNIEITNTKGTLNGKVKNSLSGTSIKNAKIEVINDNERYTVYSDPNGDYNVDNIREGKYRIIVSKDNYTQSEADDVTVLREKISTKDFSIKPISGSIFGKITDKNTGDPVASAYIKITNEDNTITAISDADGNYAMNYIPQGNYTVIASATDYIENSVGNIDVPILGDANADIALSKIPGTIKGRILNSNTSDAIIGLTITVKNIKTGEAYEASYDQSGSYLINDVPVGNYLLTATKGDFNHTFPKEIAVTSGGVAPDELWTVLMDEKPQTPVRGTLLRSKTPVITPEAPTADRLNVTQPIVELVDPNGNLISGTGSAGNIINVTLPDGTNLTAGVLEDGTWTIIDLPDLNVGDKLIVNEQDSVTLELSANVNVDIVDLELPSTGERIDFYWLNFSITFSLLLSILCLMSISRKRPK